MSNAESNTPDEMGFDAAVEALAALSESDNDTPNDESEQAQAAEQDDESDDAQDVASDESEQDEHEGTDEDDAGEDHSGDTLEELEIDGKKAKVPAWLKPYVLRQQDYTRKTQELADQRKQIELVQQQSQQMQQQYGYGLQVLQQAMKQFMPQPPPPDLWDTDPVEASRQDYHYRQQIQRWQAIEQAKQHEIAQQQAHIEQERHRALQEAMQRLPELIPAWRDPAKAKAERAEIRKTLESHGFTTEEIDTASDPRAIALAREAWLYRQLVAKKKEAKPAATKTLQPGPSRKPSFNSEADRAIKRLRQSGSRDDAFAALSLLEK